MSIFQGVHLEKGMCVDLGLESCLKQWMIAARTLLAKIQIRNQLQWLMMPTNNVIMETCNPCIHQSNSKSLMSHWRCLQHRSMAALSAMLWGSNVLSPCRRITTSHLSERCYGEVNLKVPILHFHDIQFVSKRDFSNGNHIQTHDDRFKQSQQLKASPRQQFHGCNYSHCHSKYLIPHPA